MRGSLRPAQIRDRMARARAIVRRLQKEFPEAACALQHQSPLELLIATILSAQCTDVRVNLVTPALFARYRTARDFAEAIPAELEGIIRSTGFFKAKAKNIIACCIRLVEEHRGTVPKTMEELIALPGVGRKTANVVLGNAFSVPGFAVDTHVRRIANLLKLTASFDPTVIEADLCALIEDRDWTEASHLLILHGRKTCVARRPKCGACSIRKLCPSAQSDGPMQPRSRLKNQPRQQSKERFA